ncbi:nitroreductase family protein [Tropicimonas sp. S265A]|uniref:nitroreductase family protein n=1 Tax=Tropicimonas sp. S265A TaxID=3415134 RepID=UPI003C7A9259
MSEIRPLSPLPQVLEFLRTRRSRPAKTLRAPYPDRATVAELLEIAARTPDHGKLEPWRFIVLTQGALTRLADLAEARGTDLGIDPDKVAKARASFDTAGCIVAVVASPKPSEKIPQLEQTLSAGAVCLALVNAAQAAGWGANWLSGFAAHDQEFRAQGLGLTPEETVAGFIHLGTEGAVPPDRPRPDTAALTDWVST